MEIPVNLFLLIHDNMENESIKELIYKFQEVQGLDPDIFISRSKQTVALRWKCDDFFSERASIIHVALEYIYIRYFDLLFSMRKPFVVCSNADFPYLMLLGPFIPQGFPVEKIESVDDFVAENELVVGRLRKKGDFAFYDLYNEHCNMCFFIIDKIKNNNERVNTFMTILAVYYQSCYALLQAVLFSGEDKPKNWDKHFLHIVESIKKLPTPDNDSWISMIQRVAAPSS
ncbi:hypothetical protein [Akkermansia muciniphila]|jgi:hypothetical protein|uniref:hypothetical protein n=1 Tax=Akkermansia muciniphila TaxID=239935 RepID=UPI0011AFA4D1|nr:hypothetical protein [Akkermansia muciniphila]